MKFPYARLWIIFIITVISFIIVLPTRLRIDLDSPISIHQTFSGIDPNVFLRLVGIQRDFPFRLGLDLEGGTSVTLKADMAGITAENQDAALDSAKDVIERRVNGLGVSEPIIQTAKANNEHRIIVELPGITDTQAAIALVGTTAKLEFREVPQTATLSAFLRYEETKPLDLTGADLKSAQASFDSNSGQAVVLFTVSPQSQDKFFSTTQRMVGRRMAICLDKICFTAPEVNQAIRDNGQISGGFTTEQAKQLALQLNAGALPVPLSVLEQNTIGATLGKDSLQKSIFAGVVGFVIIVAFMVSLYGRYGIVASFALLLYTLYVLAIFKLIPVTLTLAGIAGFILSIGMAVDANILIFERMKEEIRLGHKREALELGFTRAWTSIRDSNVSSLITCAILFYFGTGIVKGFALTLAIGVLVSMFSAITVTRTFLRMIYK